MLVRELLVVVGDFAVPWEAVYVSVDKLRDVYSASNPDTRLTPIIEAFKQLKKGGIVSAWRINDLGMFRKKFQDDHTSIYDAFELQDSLTWRAEAVRGQDLVYGMLGVLSPSQAEYITVDYFKTPIEFWTDYSASRIECWQSLSSFPMFSWTHLDPTLPS